MVAQRKKSNPYKNGMGPLNRLENRVAKITARVNNLSVAKKKKRNKTKNSSMGSFGPVSTTNTAPVAIGNSLQGSKPKVTSLGLDKVRVTGRDIAFTAASTGTATGWTLVGCVPLTPTAFIVSVLSNYARMYAKAKVRKFIAHYITSSSTSTNGDVVIYYNKERSSPFPNWSGTTFLNYVLSDPTSTLGPQWTNHTSSVALKSDSVIDIDTGLGVDIDQQADGELMLFSKTSSTESPGYFIIDYVIDFYETGVVPRQSSLANQQVMYQPVQLIFPTTALVANTTTIITSFGTSWVGATALSTPSYLKGGQIYKIVLDITNSTPASWTKTAGTQPTAANLSSCSTGNSNFATINLTDGWTGYLVTSDGSGTTNVLYPTFIDAISTSNPIVAQTGMTPQVYAETAHVMTTGIQLFGMISFVADIGSNHLQQGSSS